MEELSELISGLERWLFQEAFPLWWTAGADHQRGGFHEAIDARGRPIGASRRARVQARQAYVYAKAGALGWNGPWRTAMNHGLDYLLTRFPRPDGLFRASVDGRGDAADDGAVLYDQTFALLAMATAFEAEPARTDLPERAKSLLRAVEVAYHHDGVSFRAERGGDGLHANPHMHLMEAALAWSEVDADPLWPALADRVARLCLATFIDPDTGVLREHFGLDGRPARGPAGRIVEPGHQFEWAWLLHRWGVARERPDARAVARRLFQIGSRFGVDVGRGVVFNSILDDLTPLDRSARLWPQTEWIKAAITLADAAESPPERNRLLAQAVAAVKGLRLYLDTPLKGAWRDTLEPTGAFRREPAPASSFYHIVCAIETCGRYGWR